LEKVDFGDPFFDEGVVTTNHLPGTEDEEMTLLLENSKEGDELLQLKMVSSATTSK